MKKLFKITASPFIFVLTFIYVCHPFNVFSYILAGIGFFKFFDFIFHKVMDWDFTFDYPFDKFKNPIHNYLAGATVHLWSPFYATYLFLFEEEEYRDSVFNLFN